MKVGILALQGDVAEHRAILERLLNEDEIAVIKNAKQIKELNGLIIPGGESTTIGKLMVKYKVDKAILENRDLAIFGTCAGAILLSKNILHSDQFSLNLMDTTVERNAFGRQRVSFEADLKIPAIGKDPYHGVFIRAPIIRDAAEGVEILGRVNGHIVLARQGSYLASSFHPELTDDIRLHKYFLDMAKEK